MTRVVSCQNCGAAQDIEENVKCPECGKPVEDAPLGANPWNDDTDRWKCENCTQRGTGETPGACPDCDSDRTRPVHV